MRDEGHETRDATHDVDEEEDQVKRRPSTEAVRELATEHEPEDLEGGKQRRPTVMREGSGLSEWESADSLALTS